MCPLDTYTAPVKLDSQAARIAHLIEETLEDFRAARLFAAFEAGEDDGADEGAVL